MTVWGAVNPTLTHGVHSMKKDRLFYDIEAFEHYWCVVVVDEELNTRHVFEDVPSLRGYYKRNLKRTWVGYNSRQYDAPMIRFIMLGLDPYQCSQDLIVLGKKWFQFGYQITELYKRIPLRNFDCVLLNKGLKKLEGFRGSNIVESSIQWDYDKPLTREQKDEIIEYCTHDVLETRKVFYDTIEEYEAHEALVSTFDLADEHFNKSKAQLSALILGARQQPHFDEWEFEIASTIELERYQYVMDWYQDRSNHDYSKKLQTEIAGVPHVFAWGGIHGAIPKYYGEGLFINMDVRSYYPSMMIEYNFLSRNVLSPEKFSMIYWDRIDFKALKDSRQLPYKIVLNGTYGAMKDKFNALYDPRQANSVCVTGQLLLLDLIEKLEDHCLIVQSNTDGVLVKLDSIGDMVKIRAIGEEWSKRTRMVLEYEEVVKVIQKDVNNYMTVDAKGKVKSKGLWAKGWLRDEKQPDGTKVKVNDYTDYDCVILRKALQAYFKDGTPVADTINACDDLIDFQKIVMVSRKYEYAVHGTPTKVKYRDLANKGKEKLEVNESCAVVPERHLRIFASLDTKDGGIFKKHAVTKNLSKVSDSPKHAFIMNGNIEGAKASDYALDKEFYIKWAESRVKNFVKEVAV
jgi:hypothetical protein